MTSQTTTYRFPTQASDDGSVVAIGFPDEMPAPLNVYACGDGVHLFTPLTWRDLDDAVCVCGAIVPGWPVMAHVYGNHCPERIVISDPDVAVVLTTVTDD